MRVLALALLLACAHAFAGDWISSSVASYHVNRNGQNEFNPGIGGELQIAEKWRAVGGAYDNSSNNLSVYAGAMRSLTRWGPVDVGVMGIIATGYESQPIPIAGAVFSIEGKSGGVNLIAVPGAGGVFGLQIKVPW